MKIHSSTPVSLGEVKEVLSERQKAGEELAYEQQQSLDHATIFSKLSKSESISLAKSIVKTNEKVTLEAAFKIVDIVPDKIETLRAILVKDKIVLSDEDLNAIFKLLH